MEPISDSERKAKVKGCPTPDGCRLDQLRPNRHTLRIRRAEDTIITANRKIITLAALRMPCAASPHRDESL